jgi:hypothetical protein
MKRPNEPSLREAPGASGSPRRITSGEVLSQGGLFHCTSVPALRRILRDGHLRPALETGAPAHGAGVVSRCRRIGGVCLFDVLPKAEAARLSVSNPGRAWLGSWLKIAKPVTVAIHLDKARLLAHGGILLTPAQARALATGIMLKGEVCHRGAIPLSVCALGFLFVRRVGRTGLTGEYVAGHNLTKTELQEALARLHDDWTVEREARTRSSEHSANR